MAKNKERDYIEVIRMTILKAKKGQENKLKAICSVRIGNVGIDGVKVIDGNKGLFVTFPSHEGEDEKGNKKYFANIWFSCEDEDDNADSYAELTETVLTEYRRKTDD